MQNRTRSSEINNQCFKVILHETIRNDDFQRNAALHHCCDIVSNDCNIVPILQPCVALKIVVGIVPCNTTFTKWTLYQMDIQKTQLQNTSLFFCGNLIIIGSHVSVLEIETLAAFSIVMELLQNSRLLVIPVGFQWNSSGILHVLSESQASKFYTYVYISKPTIKRLCVIRVWWFRRTSFQFLDKA